MLGFGSSFDWKMYLYLVGAVMLELNVLSTMAAHYQANGSLATAMILNAILWTWFVVEYIYHEHVHLFTYDLFAERVRKKPSKLIHVTLMRFPLVCCSKTALSVTFIIGVKR